MLQLLQPVNRSAARDEALKFFTSKEGGNWTPEQAAGIVANLEAKVALNIQLLVIMVKLLELVNGILIDKQNLNKVW